MTVLLRSFAAVLLLSLLEQSSSFVPLQRPLPSTTGKLFAEDLNTDAVVSRRKTLDAAALVAAAAAAAAASSFRPSAAFADALGADQYKSGIRGADPKGDVYALPDLPYDEKALQPHVSGEGIASGRAAQSRAVATLNGFYNGKGKNIPLYKLQGQAKGLPSPELRAAAGAHYNYCLFFASMTPEDDSSAPSPVLRKLFDAQFGGEDGVLEAFAKAGAEQLKDPTAVAAGGLWLWLGVRKGNKLEVTATSGQANPLWEGEAALPFLCLDVSPAAYAAPYGEGQAALEKYVAAWFNNVVNWRRVSANFIQFANNNAPVPCTQGDLLGLPPPSFV